MVSALSRSDVTALLHAWSAGDQSAKEKLWAIVFPELAVSPGVTCDSNVQTTHCRRVRS